MSNDAETTTVVPTTYERLAAPFAVEDHAKVNKGSGSQTYAPWTSYVQRLNDELGPNWSFRVVREGFTPTECWVLGEITAIIDGVTVVRQQYGCEPITKGQRETPTSDLLKTAASDAIKKAASLLGPGLYLSVKEEREAIEAEMRAAVQAEAQRQAEGRKTPPKPTTSEKVHAAAVITGADPTPLKTKVELAADVRKGIEYARSLGLDVADVDCGPLNRADIESVLESLRHQCLEARRVAKASS